MAQHDRNDESGKADLRKHAAQANALLQSRNAGRGLQQGRRQEPSSANASVDEGRDAAANQAGAHAGPSRQERRRTEAGDEAASRRRRQKGFGGESIPRVRRRANAGDGSAPRGRKQVDAGDDREPWQAGTGDGRVPRQADAGDDREPWQARRRVDTGDSHEPQLADAGGGREPRRAGTDDDRETRRASGESIGEFVRRNIGYIASVALVVVLATAGLFAARMLLPDQSNAQENQANRETQKYASPFDWTNLDRSNGRYRYLVGGEVKSHLGVDVSESNLEIDWQAVAEDGIEFAMIRLGYRGATKGDLYVDEQFWANLDGARAAGIKCGVYFFSQADTVDDADEEADFVLSQLNGIELEYPIAFDSEVVNLKGEESPTANLTEDEMTAISDAFCTRMQKSGYRTLIYGNAYDLARYHSSLLDVTPVWWAEYNTPAPSARLDLVMWQYSNSGQVAGIPTNVDMNLDLSEAL